MESLVGLFGGKSKFPESFLARFRGLASSSHEARLGRRAPFRGERGVSACTQAWHRAGRERAPPAARRPRRPRQHLHAQRAQRGSPGSCLSVLEGAGRIPSGLAPLEPILAEAPPSGLARASLRASLDTWRPPLVASKGHRCCCMGGAVSWPSGRTL